MTSTAHIPMPAIDAPLDAAAIRADFPILSTTVHGKPLVYLDNAATTQKPKLVIEALHRYYMNENANVHRGVHYLSQLATGAYEDARRRVQDFIHARSEREIIFTRGTTEAINLVAQSYGRTFLKADDEIVLSGMEHHSNIVPWQLLGDQVGTKIRVVPLNEAGECSLADFEETLTPRTKLVAITHISNALGSVNPVKEMIALAHARGIPVLVDGAQAVAHMPVNVRDLDADFYAFSGHKLYAPSGVGVLFGKQDLLEKMPPWQGGGDMIASVSFEKTLYNDLPYKFEAGTPHISGGIGLGVATDYITRIGLKRIAAYEHELLAYGTQRLLEVPGLRLIGTAQNKAGILSFVLNGIHPHDIGTILDQDGIAIRAGHHCAQPVMDRYKLPATARASLAFYNTRADLDALVESLQKVVKMFQ